MRRVLRYVRVREDGTRAAMLVLRDDGLVEVVDFIDGREVNRALDSGSPGRDRFEELVMELLADGYRPVADEPSPRS